MTKKQTTPGTSSRLGLSAEEIAKVNSVSLFPAFFKALLRRLAREGSPRPSSKAPDALERRLGQRLGDYTRTSSLCYDENFLLELRRLRPDWLEKGKSASQWKELILQRARAGLAKPLLTAQGEELLMARALAKFIGEKSSNCDPAFRSELTKLRPDWYPQRPRLIDLREVLLARAQAGGEKPDCNSPREDERLLAQLLWQARSKRRGKELAALAQRIEAMRPEWFRGQKAGVQDKLLQLAEQGRPRPKRGQEKGDRGEEAFLAVKLSSYLHRKGANREFVARLSSLSPQWLAGRSQVIFERRVQAIEDRRLCGTKEGERGADIGPSDTK